MSCLLSQFSLSICLSVCLSCLTFKLGHPVQPDRPRPNFHCGARAGERKGTLSKGRLAFEPANYSDNYGNKTVSVFSACVSPTLYSITEHHVIHSYMRIQTRQTPFQQVGSRIVQSAAAAVAAAVLAVVVVAAAVLAVVVAAAAGEPHPTSR